MKPLDGRDMRKKGRLLGDYGQGAANGDGGTHYNEINAYDMY